MAWGPQRKPCNRNAGHRTIGNAGVIWVWPSLHWTATCMWIVTSPTICFSHRAGEPLCQLFEFQGVWRSCRSSQLLDITASLPPRDCYLRKPLIKVKKSCESFSKSVSTLSSRWAKILWLSLLRDKTALLPSCRKKWHGKHSGEGAKEILPKGLFLSFCATEINYCTAIKVLKSCFFHITGEEHALKSMYHNQRRCMDKNYLSPEQSTI